jgi:anaerobic dimethyl sulfoxide reductase subunit B (iron-sulfur subunit)
VSRQLGFIFNMSRCCGCMSCIVACQDQNDLPPEGPSFRRVVKFERSGAAAEICWISVACEHCEDAACLEACPAGAIFREDVCGVVAVNRELCAGCQACADACPFGAPQFLNDGRMAKCHLCHEQLTSGALPACVRACPTRALDIGLLDGSAKEEAARKLQAMLKRIQA